MLFLACAMRDVAAPPRSQIDTSKKTRLHVNLDPKSPLRTLHIGPLRRPHITRDPGAWQTLRARELSFPYLADFSGRLRVGRDLNFVATESERFLRPLLRFGLGGQSSRDCAGAP